MIHICGSARNFTQGKCLGEAEFEKIYSICIDPLNPSCSYYVGDITSVRNCTSETVSLLVGAYEFGFEDGVGGAARFFGVDSIVATSGGDKLYVSDAHNHRIRRIKIKSRSVRTLAGNGKDETVDGVGLKSSIMWPRKIIFDRSPTTEPESALFISSLNAIRRLDLSTRRLTTCPWNAPRTGHAPAPEIEPSGLNITPSGHLIVSCTATSSVYLFDPKTGNNELLAGRGSNRRPSSVPVDGTGKFVHFREPRDLVVVESEQCLYLVDSAHRCVRHMTLPPSLFVAPTRVQPIPVLPPKPTSTCIIS